MHPWKTISEIKSENTSSDEFSAFIHQVRGQVIITNVLMEAQEIQTTGAQATTPDKHTLQIYC